MSFGATPGGSRCTATLALWLAFVAAVACLVLSSCSGPEARGRAEAPGTYLIEFWDFPHLPKTNEYLRQAIQRFEASHQGVRVRYTKLPWQDGQQKVILAVNSGRPPDVCGQVNVSSRFIAQEVLEPLEAFLQDELADFHEEYIEAVSYGGHIYAVPWYKACYVALLNLDLFEKFGVEPPRNGRWTWAEFVQKMRALTKYETPDGQIHDGLAPAELAGRCKQYYGVVTNLGPMEYEAYSIIFNAGGRILERNAQGDVVSGVGSPAFLEGVRRLIALEREYKVAQPKIGAMTQEQSWNIWRDSRTCAVTFQGAWCITAVEVANAAIERTNERKRAAGRLDELENPIRYAIAAPPHDPGTTPVLGSSGLGTYVVFRQRDPEKRRLCAEFVKFLVSGEGQRVLRFENVYPSRKSTGNPWADHPMLGPVFALFPAGIMSPLVLGGERIDKVLQQEIQRALLGQAAPEAAVRGADAKVRAILERARRQAARVHVDGSALR
ncbi:MAG: ABC transporter substrate-binding protein [Candidatus Sumerlaeaceae bacterium]|jgi:multiple sugar transport system substrate-binding protein